MQLRSWIGMTLAVGVVAAFAGVAQADVWRTSFHRSGGDSGYRAAHQRYQRVDTHYRRSSTRHSRPRAHYYASTSHRRPSVYTHTRDHRRRDSHRDIWRSSHQDRTDRSRVVYRSTRSSKPSVTIIISTSGDRGTRYSTARTARNYYRATRYYPVTHERYIHHRSGDSGRHYRSSSTGYQGSHRRQYLPSRTRRHYRR